VFYLLLALPISIADLSQRKIPNIYLQLYAYYVGALLIVNGVPNASFMLLVFLTLGLLSFSGVGMGDCKLLALIVVMLGLNELIEFEQLLIAIPLSLKLCSDGDFPRYFRERLPWLLRYF